MSVNTYTCYSKARNRTVTPHCTATIVYFVMARHIIGVMLVFDGFVPLTTQEAERPIELLSIENTVSSDIEIQRPI